MNPENRLLIKLINFLSLSVLYKEGPGITHADYIVVIRVKESKTDWISILGHVRMANTTVKVAILI